MPTLAGLTEFRHDADIIHDLLKDAAEHGMVTEVVWSALRIAQRNPEWSSVDCVSAAMDDWDI